MDLSLFGHLESLVILLMAGYFCVLVWIASRADSGKNYDDYILASRSVGHIATIGSLASGFRDGMGLVLWIGMAFTIGYGGLWLIFGIIFSLVVVALLGPRVRRESKANGYVTIGDLLSHELGAKTEVVLSLIIVAFSALYVAIQIYVISNLFEGLFSLNPEISALLTVLVVGLYLYQGGYGAVVRTDVLQFFLIISLVFFPLLLRPSLDDVFRFKSLFSLDVVDQVALFLIGSLYILSGAEVWQRVFSAKNDQVVTYSFPIAGVFLLVMTLVLIFIGYGVKNLMGAGIAADDVLFKVFEVSDLSPWLLAYLAVIVVAVSMSTLDTFAYVFSSTVIENVLPKKIVTSKMEYVRLSRFIVTFLLIVMALLSLSITDVIKFLFDSASLLFVMAPVFLGVVTGIIEKSKCLDRLIAISVSCGATVYIIMFVNGAFESLIMNIVPVFVSTVLCAVSVVYCKVLERRYAGQSCRIKISEQ